LTSPCEVCGGQGGNGSASFFPLPSPHHYFVVIIILYC